jgi:hypothetical protein
MIGFCNSGKAFNHENTKRQKTSLFVGLIVFVGFFVFIEFVGFSATGLKR